MLLHVCCAPCALPIIEHLLSDFPPTADPPKAEKDISLYFCNPNIWPAIEYEKRFKEVEKIASIYNLRLIQEKYGHGEWLNFIKENLPCEIPQSGSGQAAISQGKPQSPEKYLENSERCLVCFKFRLNQTALFAKTHGFKEFATTLSVSRYKDVKFINQYADRLAKKIGLVYKTFSLDPKKAHQTGINLSKKYGIYRQKYCGCEFSL